MTQKTLKPTVNINMFGANVVLSGGYGKDKTVDLGRFKVDPVGGRNKDLGLKDGYSFRSPDCSLGVAYSAIDHLSDSATPNGYNWWIEQDKDSKNYTGYAVVVDKEEASIFAWGNYEHWQKWSAEKEEEEVERRNSKSKLTVTADGRLVGKVTVESIDDL